MLPHQHPETPPSLSHGRARGGSEPPGETQAGPRGTLDGYDIEAQIGFLLRRAHQRHAALFQEGMAALDLTPTQFNALIRVVEHAPVTQNLLGRLSAMDPATIQGVVRRLVERGLVLREFDPADRRTILLSPTPSGQALAARAVAHGRRITEATLAPLDTTQRAALLTLLTRIT